MILIHPSIWVGRHGVRRRPPTDRTGAVIANSAFSANTCGRGRERWKGANKGPSALRANLTCISWSSDCDPIRLAREEGKEGKENHLPPSLSTGRGREDHIRPQREDDMGGQRHGEKGERATWLRTQIVSLTNGSIFSIPPLRASNGPSLSKGRQDADLGEMMTFR